MEFFEKTIESETLFEGKIFTVKREKTELMDGSVATREIVLHSGGAAILPVDQNGYVTLVRQFRCGVKRELLEICAGKIEKGENPKDCAVRELYEELGIRAKTVTELGHSIPTPAYDSEVIYVYLATGIEYGEQKLDAGEFLQTVKMPLADAVELVMQGKIEDAKTQIALLKAQRLLNGKD